MALGELLNKTAVDFKKNFRALFQATLLFLVIPAVIIAIINLSFTGTYSYNISEQQFISPFHIILFFTLSLISGVLFLVSNSGILKASVRKEKFELRDIVYFGKKNWLKYLGLLIIFFLFSAGLFLLLIIPAIIFMVYWTLSTYVLFDEEKGILYSLKKSRKLVKGNWWRMFGHILFMLLAIFILELIFYLPIKGMFDPVDLKLTVSLTNLIIGTISYTLISLVTYGFFTLFFKNFYVELKSKAKKEIKEKIKPEKKGFVWYATRISFYLLIILMILQLFNSYILRETIIINLLIPFVLIISIVHLFMHRKKTVPILAVILSVVSGLILAVAMLLAFISTIDQSLLAGYNQTVNVVNETNSVIGPGNYQYSDFEAYREVNMSLFYNSDKPADLFLFDSGEFDKFKNGQDYEYLGLDENITFAEYEDIGLERGDYYFVIWPINDEERLTYNLTAYIY